ncbi:MAG: methenyltetrahydrofolate cyclohydrolase, partial [Candidatus Cloacimonetes bacterium]|nr:methenyltetrahydrofolate cyclohydrolase [Candidatus Cloacimonadota bacterium]
AAKAAYYNIRINMLGSTDEAFKTDILPRSQEIIKQCESLAAEVEKEVLEQL